MQIWIRFLTFGSMLPKDYQSFSVPQNSTAASLLSAVICAGKAGAFCAPADWPSLSEYVLLAARAHMLKPDEVLLEGEQISIIGQMLGG